MKTLWSIYIPGPDEYHAAPSKGVAKYMAAKHTTAMQEYVAKNKLACDLEMISAEVAEWPGTAKEHAKYVSEFDYAAWGLKGGAA